MAELVLRDGARLAYREWGAGRPLLLVHGWAAHGGFFSAQRDLASGFRLIELDLRGHGGSDAAPGPLTVEVLAADLADMMAQLELQDVLAVGWSLGAMALWRLLEGPAGARIAGMVVIDMSPRIVNDPGWALGLKGGYDLAAVLTAQVAMRADWPGFGRQLAQRIVAEGLSEERAPLIDWVEREVLACRPGPLIELWGSLASQDVTGKLTGFDVPTLVAYGERSQLYPAATAAFLTERLPRASSVRFERSGHALHLEEPERFNQAVTQFAAALPRLGKPQPQRPPGEAADFRRDTP